MISGTGTLSGTTVRSTVNGLATFGDLIVNLSGQKQLTATSGGLVSDTSSAFTISPSGAVLLAIQVEPPPTQAAGDPFSPQPVVWIVDAQGNTVTGDNTTSVTASRLSGSGSLQGTTTVAAVNGVASFSNLSHNVSGTITIQFTAAGLVPDTSTSIIVTPAAPDSATDVIVDTTNNAYYVLMAGRWFRAPGLGGPWTFVASKSLPPSFRQIPAKGTPASIVLASVAGTPQAQEAVIANSIPQTAAVARSGGPTFTPVFDGAPQWQPIAGTPLTYVVNSKVPVIQVNPDAYYAVTGGVWFTASALTGPWAVATSVPGVIYTIPVSSPLHYVTYVHVYGNAGNVVYVGYTPGYLGTVVDVGGTVVYGTGYAYNPWVGSVWYGAHLTYGIAAMPFYNPYVGYTFGFAMGLTAAYWAEPYWGGAYYHAGYYGYPCCGSATADVYRSWPGGVSSGTRTYWADNGGAFGTTAAGSYSTDRGTSGTYNAQRSWNPYTGQGSEGYNRTFNTAAGTTGSVNRDATYNAQTGGKCEKLCVTIMLHKLKHLNYEEGFYSRNPLIKNH